MARIPKTKKDKKELKRLREESNYKSPIKNLSDYRASEIDRRIAYLAIKAKENYLRQKIRVEINVFNESENQKIKRLLFSSQTGIYNLDLWDLTEKNEKSTAELIDHMISEKLLPYMVNEIKKTLKEKAKTYLQELRKLRKEALGLWQ